MLLFKNILFFLSFFILNASTTHKVKYQIDASSKMCLKVSTNISSIICNCEDKYSPEYFIAEVDASSNSIGFSKTSLRINVKSINCKNFLLNKDLHKSLEADKFPSILFELHSLIPSHFERELKHDKEYSYTAKTIITIAGKSRPQQIKVSINKCDENTYQLRATKELSMAEYCIKPISPVNFIKISDNVAVILDLTIKTL